MGFLLGAEVFLGGGLAGPASILLSYMQVAFDWHQGRFETLGVVVGLPSGVAAALLAAFVHQRHGLQGVIRYGAVALGMAATALVGVPWAPGLALLVYIIFIVCGSTALLALPILVAKKFPVEDQAKCQALFEVAGAVTLASASIVYSHHLFDPDAGNAFRQSVPFIVGWALAVVGVASLTMVRGPQDALPSITELMQPHPPQVPVPPPAPPPGPPPPDAFTAVSSQSQLSPSPRQPMPPEVGPLPLEAEAQVSPQTAVQVPEGRQQLHSNHV